MSARRGLLLAAALASTLASPAAFADAPPADAPAPAGPAAAVAPPAPAQGPRIAYESGVEVTITSKDPATEVFLAHGDVPIGVFPDPFERIGLTPITIKLAAGTYSIETAAPTQSGSHERFMVEQGRPVHVEVHPGDANVKAVGAVLAGLGVASIVLGIIAIVSFSPNDQTYNRFGIGLPLVIGGAAGCGIGVGMSFLGATTLKIGPATQPARPVATFVPALTFAF